MRSAFSRPTIAASFVSGLSSSYWIKEVDAAVEPRTAPRRSTTTTRSPASDNISAIKAPDIPAPMTSASHTMSRTSVDSAIRGQRRDCQIE